MKNARVVGLTGMLLLAAGCGSSGDDQSSGSPDASLDGTGGVTPGSDAAGGADSTAPSPGDDGGAEASTGDDDGGSTCGDGIVSGNEQCDDGPRNGTPGDPCTNSCTWVCVYGDPTLGNPACNDGNPCNGTETCEMNHSCAPGTPPASGSSCGTGRVCNGGSCVDAVCGDGFVTPPEECDDGSKNGTPTDGCTKQCTFVCVSTDPTRDCAPSDPCGGKGTCNDTTHLCAAGTPEGDGTICAGGGDAGADAGTIDVCKTGTCVPGYCGDGVVEPPEQCDFGAGNGAGTGCELNCRFSCTETPSNSCVTTDPCGGTNTCTTVTVNGRTGQACKLGTPPANGTACTGGTCQSGSCKTSLCGNGVLDPNEQCDFGSANNLPGSGCEPDCEYSCQTSPDSCPNDDLCAAAPTTCQKFNGPNAEAGPAGIGQKCQAATRIPTCGDCGSTTTGICTNDKCGTSVCGDGCVDPRTGEQCEPPGTATCDAQCHTIAAAVCGNGKREAGEQCDDGNTTNLDGCNAKCQFEQIQRATTVAIETGTDAPFCPNNALGSKALTSVAVGQLNTSLTSAVNSGTTTIEFDFLGITDLTGTSQTTGLTLGPLSGTPVAAPTGVTYSGSSDLDWWYTTAADTIDATRTPLSPIAAQLNAAVLSTPTPGTLTLRISLSGSPAVLSMSDAGVTAHIGPTSKPTVSTGTTPGHLASENLDPSLTSFASMSAGFVCGNVSAASLATVAVPSILQSGGSFACSKGYTSANSLLDVLVGGCTFGGVVDVVNATQPDQVNAGAPAAGAGGLYTLVATGSKVTGCKDKSGATVDFNTCLNAAAYSSYFGFTSDRVIAK